MLSLTATFESSRHVITQAQPGDLILFTMRHGQSRGQINQNAYKDLGDDNLPLTRRGVLQSRAAAQILLQLTGNILPAPIRILTSNGVRASRTATEIFAIMGSAASITRDSRLDKQKFGKFDGLFTWPEREALFPKESRLYKEQAARLGEFHARNPDGESIADVQRRLSSLIEDLLLDPQPTIIVTHGTNELCIDNLLMKRGDEWVMKNIDKRANCSIQLFMGNPKTFFSSQSVCGDPLEEPGFSGRNTVRSLEAEPS